MSAPARYARTSIALHWLMLLLLIGVYACIELRELYPKGSEPREALKAWHFTLGLSVFALAWLRLFARLRRPAPPISPRPAAWQRGLAHLLHTALYALMIGLPLAGWVILSAAGKPVPFYGFELPPLVAPDKALAERLVGLHKSAGTAGYFLIALHAAAGLYHHYVVRDDTLARMLPGVRSRP
jgi:superoxide oxidase